MSITRDDFLRRISDLPALPAVVLDVLDSFGEKDVNLSVLAEKLLQDQALTARTLRLANSSFYGLSRKVTTIEQAITILGFNNVRAIIATASVMDHFAKAPHDGFDFKAFWLHSIATALCAKFLARHVKINQGYAFITGLVHDIGRLALVTCFPGDYALTLAERETRDCHLHEAEQSVLGMDHAEAGRLLAGHWKFPPIMQQAIARHHAPPEPNGDDGPGLTEITHIADAMAHALDLPAMPCNLVPGISPAIWNRLGLDAPSFSAICWEAESEFDKACQLLAT